MGWVVRIIGDKLVDNNRGGGSNRTVVTVEQWVQ